MDLKEQEAIGDQIDSHWYYTSKAQMMADHIRRLTGGVPVKRVMDVGAGAGWFRRWMLREGLAAARRNRERRQTGRVFNGWSHPGGYR